jgi:hypothetical protein
MRTPTDYGISGDIDPDIGQALAELIEMGLIVDSGKRRRINGKMRIVWVAVPELKN